MTNFVSQVMDFLLSEQGGVTIIVLIIAGAWQYWRYIKEWNFRNYHKLIKELVQSDTPYESIKLDRQVAVIYELRNYPRYFAVSKRILQGWLDSKGEKLSKEYSRLYTEMELCVECMNKKFLVRCWDRFFEK